MLSTTASYLAVTNNLAKQQAATASEPAVKTATAYYLANIGKVTSISDFVNNYRLFSYAMTAYGLQDMTYAKGLMTKVLEGGVTSSTALANTLSDPRYKAFAQAFNFAANGAAATQTTAATTATVSNYVEQTLETNQGQQNQGVQLALYFTRNAASVTNLYGLLADKDLLQVVQTAFGLPSSANQNIDSEEQTLAKYVSVADLKNPAKVQQIAERFTAMYDLSGADTSAQASNISQIFSGSSSSSGISSSVLLSLQGLRIGGS